MKQKLLKTMLLLCALVVGGASSVWAAENDTHDFSQSLSQLLNNNASISSISIAEQSYPVKEIIVSYNYNKNIDNAVTISATVGGNAYGSSHVVSKSETSTASFSGSSTSGAIEISFVNGTGNGTGHGTFKVTNVRLVEGASATPSKVSTPTFSPAAGAVAYNTSVSISCGTAGAAIYYTTNGTDPTSSSTPYSSPIAITAATTLKAIAVKDGLTDSSIGTAAYTIAPPAAPTFNVSSGSIPAGTKVTITGTGTIRYTTNGTDPTSSTGTVYSEPVEINSSCTLKAICVDGGGNVSSVTSANYGIITPVAGYTIDFESVPAAYTDWTMTNVGQSSGSISAHGGTYYGTTSGKSSASIVTAAKVAKPEALTFYVSKTSSNTTSSTWYVEVSSNGSDWSEITSQSATSMTAGSWTKVECDIVDGSEDPYENVYVRIRYEGSTAVRTIDDITLTEVMPVATPTFSVAAGTYTSVQSVTITCGTAGATIYYTTDGTDPTSSSTAYSSAVSINESCTLKAIAIKGDDESNIASATYTINLPTDYNLASTITSGKHYVIASSKADGTVKVMTSQSSEYRNTTDATVSSDVLSATGACEIVIYGPDASGNYALYDANANGYLYASSSSNNYLKTQASIDNTALWSIVIDGTSGEATIVAQGTNTRKYMRYNYNSGNSPRISCYASTSELPKVYLFEKDGEATPTESVTVSSVGYATYASDNALDFTGKKSIEAYIATTKGDGTGVTFTRKYKIPARTGVLLHADGGATIDIPALAGGTAADAVTGNVFVKGAGAAVATDGDTSWNYILNNGASGLGFYKAAGQTVAKNRAYISILKSESASVKGFIALPGSEETAVEAVKAEAENGVIFNLAGQRVQKLQRGINIVNGRKIVVK